MKLWMIYYLVINIVAFFTYGLDKWKAKRDAWRVPEKTLLGMAALGGALGALLGMHVFHHKTKKAKFSVGVPFFLVIHVVLVFMFIRNELVGYSYSFH